MNIVTHVLAFMAGGLFGFTALALLVSGGSSDYSGDPFCQYEEGDTDGR